MNGVLLPQLLLPLLLLCRATQLLAGLPTGLGVGGGLDSAIASTESGRPVASRTGLMVGTAGEVGMSSPFCIQVKATYARKGAKAPGLGITYKYDYLQFPLTLEAELGGREFRPYIFAVPNLGIDLSPRRGFSFTENFVELLDFAIYFGGRIEYGFSSKTGLLFDIRCLMGPAGLGKATTCSWKSRGFNVLTEIVSEL